MTRRIASSAAGALTPSQLPTPTPNLLPSRLSLLPRPRSPFSLRRALTRPVFALAASQDESETSERLKIQADIASRDLSAVLNEISEENKVYFATAAGHSPEPLKEIVETYASSTEEVSSFEGFGISMLEYCAGLSVGGFLYFLVTGSVSAIRFGAILGGALLALSIYSLKSWKSGGSSPLGGKGQAAIAGILFLRELRLLSQRVSFSTLHATLFSGAMVGTYIYMFVVAGKKSNPEQGMALTFSQSRFDFLPLVEVDSQTV